MYGPYHRTGAPGGPGCPVGVLPTFAKGTDGYSLPCDLLDAGEHSTELQLLRTVATGFGAQWGVDEFGWWAAVPGHSFPSWAVWRQDDGGTRYLVAANLSEAQATAMVADYEARGHKQTFWCNDQRPQPP